MSNPKVSTGFSQFAFEVDPPASLISFLLFDNGWRVWMALLYFLDFFPSGPG